MKFLFINGSPEEKGVINGIFERMILKSDCECTKIQIPITITPCINCRNCKDNTNFYCDEFIRSVVPLIQEADAIILGSPVYYGGITSQMKSFLTKLFYSNPKTCNYKPIGLVVSSRRAGSVMALSEFALPFLMHSNFIIGSTYWNEVYGDNYTEAQYDYEGLQTIDNLIENIKYVTNGLLDKQKPNPPKFKHINYISKDYIELKERENEKNNKYTYR